MIQSTSLTDYLFSTLNCDAYNDYAPNGLQVEGKLTLHKICTAVTASMQVIEEAVRAEADALIVHHGFFWRGEDLTVTGVKRQRLAKLLNHDINLYAYHLPLDCHQELGNNIKLGHLLGIEQQQPHTAGKTPNLLMSGLLTQETRADDFAVVLSQKLQRAPLHIRGSNNPIRRIAWCSGAAQDFIEVAHKLGVDAYLSGEISERTYYQAMELGIHYFACGHHATERYGIQALGKHLADKFDLKHQFIDSENPV